MKKLEKNGISSQCPVHLLHRLLNMEGFENAEKAMKTALSIPNYPSLTNGKFETIAKVLRAEVK